MLFNSVHFLIFFPTVVLLYFVLPRRARSFCLLLASYVFYMGWDLKYALLLFFSTAITYGAALLVERARSQNKVYANARLILIVSLVLTFCLLFYYKYLNFALSTVARAFSLLHINVSVPQFDIILPVGISFFTFQVAGYLIDVWRGDITAERNFFRYALFVSFFPQLVAGPIERSRNLLVQLEKPAPFDFARAKSGILTMLYGYLLKMVVADRAAVLVDFVFANDAATGVQVAFATFIFAFQIYCDFYGYSVIAAGAARVLGISLMENFNAPYFAVSFKDFWRRWHISLSTWFRDYLYIPLGGSRRGRIRKNVNTMLIMLASGIWHGAGFHFVAWGFLNGIFQVFDDLTGSWRKRIEEQAEKRGVTMSFALETIGKKLGGSDRPSLHFCITLSSLWHLLQSAATFCGVCLCWLFFRASSLRTAVRYVWQILFSPQLSTLRKDWLLKYGMDKNELKFLLGSIAVLLIVDFLKYKGVRLQDALLQRSWLLQEAAIIVAVLVLAVAGVWGAGYNAASFIYFQF